MLIVEAEIQKEEGGSRSFGDGDYKRNEVEQGGRGLANDPRKTR